MKKLTFVIPAYNAHDTIEKTLNSIVNQLENDQLKVIIVNDKSEKDYKEVVEKFKDLIDIKSIDLEKNGGPGVARRVGLEACDTPYITFIDADDIYLDMMFAQGTVDFLDNVPNCTNVNVNFLEQSSQKNRYTNHSQDTIWVFGKVYRVDFLKKNNITFSDLRSNEDLEFNLKINLSQKDDEFTQFVNDKQAYLWSHKADSITRKNNAQYSYYEGLIGAVQAKMGVMDFENSRKERIIQMAPGEVIMIYNFYNSSLYHRPTKKKWHKEILKVYAEYYHNYLKKHWENLTEEEQITTYLTLTKNSKDFHIPKITFDKFIKMLENEKLN